MKRGLALLAALCFAGASWGESLRAGAAVVAITPPTGHAMWGYGDRPHLAVALLNRSLGFVSVSEEFFCGHSLALKCRARLEQLFFLGYCNDYHQYYPTIEAAGEGGYGTQPPLAPAEPGAGERAMDRALMLLYQMRGLIPEDAKR
jgi:hypothetical protein